MSRWSHMMSLGLAMIRRNESVAEIARNLPQRVVLIPGMSKAEPVNLLVPYDEAKHPRRAIVELKANGIRALAPPGFILSREALPLDCALHCRPGLDRLEEAYGEPMVFDGEYVEDGGFEATLAAHKRRSGAGVLWLFDAVPYREWSKNRFTQPLHERKARLAELLEQADSPFIGLLQGWELNAAETKAKAAELWALGYEGVAVKDANAPYYRGRGGWMKLKQRQSADLVCYDVAVREGKAVSLLCRDGKRTVKVTAGMSEAERIAFARQPMHLTGLTIEVGFTDRTDSGAYRGVSFIRVRQDRARITGRI